MAKQKTALQRELQSVEEIVIALRRLEHRNAQHRVLSAAVAIVENASAARVATTATNSNLRWVE